MSPKDSLTLKVIGSRLLRPVAIAALSMHIETAS
jgi:hypothetical protein